MNVENIAKMRAMEEVYKSGNPRLVDMQMAAGYEPDSGIKLKRIQFDTTFELSEELDRVTDLLGMSRREFLEAALIDALDRARSAFLSTYKEVAGGEFAEGKK